MTCWGYQLAQAAILTSEAFTRTVGEPLDLRKAEFTILQLVQANAPVTAARVAKSLAVKTPASRCGLISWSNADSSRASAAPWIDAPDTRS